jgi:Domain of unknown function (DUF397)
MDTIDSDAWRTSSYTGTNGNCVEVAGTGGAVLVRDTKDRDGVALSIPSDAWASFAASLK